ncbi:TPA: conjugal transfer protein [Clostridioides difficile]|uniref:conjugal transfer protein n=1 Tax=Bacillota TaxID=1239 RepID=UPI0018DD244C|nr:MULTISPECIES: conjugal transfer protein [Bacillota]EGT5404937.1 conjugal transfer protein [Clostridioides difficile]MBH9931650.1 conjugal transfer protein [Clostridioides difficile]MBH9952034.1 conjugal transfer protein [Clostridioides difficile]MCG4878723.1 conjugal transfer protein [Amedibacillus dolichus]MCL1024173.1 conjugal transfer protein [Clostridioides difficile]
MKWKKKKQTENKQEMKEKKKPTLKVGTHKKSVIALWAVLIVSVSFGVYKNFTAIDMHTVHEKETVQLRLNDTNGIENFVKNFCKAYYTWDNSKETLEKRTSSINGYLTEELQVLNADTIRTDIPTSSTVSDVLIWNVEQSGNDEYEVLYEVVQSIKEGDQTRSVRSSYMVTVHVDTKGNMIIVQNPTLAPMMETSDYEPKTVENDSQVDADTVSDATAFLETFFKLYPTATDKELAYYVEENVMEPVQREYQFAEVLNPVFTKDGDNIKVNVSVKYLDNLTKAEQISQYELILHKDSNWKIVG